MTPTKTFIDIGFNMHLRDWRQGGETKRPFMLVHGLSSNAQTWDGVARKLAAAGHPVVAIDQRGHGLSDKPPAEAGYDFATVTGDIVRLVEALGWHKPLIAGQSWGGNVMLALGALHPELTSGLIFVDGGFFNVKRRAPIWDDAYEMFKPPHLIGTPRADMVARMKQFQPEWSDEGIDGTLANFETLADDTIQPWLTLDRHMEIFRAMWEQDPPTLFPLIKEPVLICAAGDDSDVGKATMVSEAEQGIADAELHWFANTAHDIHVHRPKKLASLFLDWASRKQLR